MMLETRADISKAQRKLEATLRRELPRTALKNIGFPGDTRHDVSVRTDGRTWYWSSDNNKPNVPNQRRLNWFGIYREDGDLQITVEINTTYEGRNDQVAGFFARDNETGAIYLFHSGRVGGGTKGVSKSAFLAWSDQPLIDVADSAGDVREGVIVMPIEGLAATRSAVRYIDTIARFKQAVRDDETNSPEFQRKIGEFEDFYAESRGRRKGRRSSKIDYVSRHGDVVDAVCKWRKQKLMPSRARIVKNVLIDMGVAVGRGLIEVFEIKTSTSRSDVYSAIGQLMVHGTSSDCRRVVVLPDDGPLPDDLNDAIRRLDIQLLRFTLDEQEAHIIDGL
ncbi:hypothetical protein [Paraburkholderia acidipaludis]|uniref:hypothetical protein n=1 Tax=Paraburkholderia acidipaludis TaxID=660537 RepID=UPI001FDF3087|nr:hypothetical protein [Paraburkholderia acidipaludis]